MKRIFLLLILMTSVLVTYAVPPIVNAGNEYRHHRQRVAKPKLRYASQSAQIAGKLFLPPKGVLILAEFQDVRFTNETSVESIDSLANGSNYTYGGAWGSVAEYYKAQSNGQYDIHFDVVGPVTLPHEMAYYGENNASDVDGNTGDFVADAVEEAHKIGVNFSSYDSNMDGYIYFVYIIYAGFSEADKRNHHNAIWPHGWDLKSNYYYGCTKQDVYYYRSRTDFNLPKYDGLILNEYVCSNELRRDSTRAPIGTFVHEFAHQLGLPDYYATSEDWQVEPYTPGCWSTMGYACYTNNGRTPCNFSAYDKYFFGWVEPELLKHNQLYTLPADNKTCYLITRDGETPKNGAFTNDTIYYFENRQYESWDYFLPGHGLLVWRVIYDDNLWYNNNPNKLDTIGYTLITADGSTPYNTNTFGRACETMPFPGTNGVTQLTLFGHYCLEDIQEENGVISFRFVDTNELPTKIEPRISDLMPEKQIINGRMCIRKGEEKYDVLGRKLR